MIGRVPYWVVGYARLTAQRFECHRMVALAISSHKCAVRNRPPMVNQATMTLWLCARNAPSLEGRQLRQAYPIHSRANRRANVRLGGRVFGRAAGLRWAGYALAVFGALTLTALLAPTLVGRRPIGRRERRRRIRNACIAAMLVPLMVLTPRDVQALHVEALQAHTLAGLVVGQTVPEGTAITTYSYDANGNTTGRLVETSTSSLTDSFVYTAENRLASADAQTGSAGTVAYTYDADGIRNGKTAGGVTTLHITDKNQPYAQVLEERGVTGSVQTRYVYGDDLICQVRNPGPAGVTSYYHYDGQMSTRQLTDDNAVPGSVVITDTYTYDAYGIETATAGTTENAYRYTGEQYDADVGLYYLRARYYDQETGRFHTRDPAGGRLSEPHSLHKYLYATADPLNNIDPTGRYTFSLSGLLKVAALTGVLFGLVAGTVQYARGKTAGEILVAVGIWFLIGALVGASVYGAAWLVAYFAGAAVVVAPVAPEAINRMLQNVARLQHAFHRHCQGILRSYEDLRPIISQVLSKPEATKSIKLGADRAIAYAAQVDVNGTKEWVSVAIYETGSLAGELATAVMPYQSQFP